MLRTVSLAIALFAFAGVAIADCGGAHSAKEALSHDQEANASKAPTVAKTALPATAHKSVDVKNAKSPVKQKTSPDKLAANKPAE
jgi:hypothetical protein